MRDKKYISILCPTRQRPQLAEQFARSIADTSVDIDRVEVLFYVDNDDPCMGEYRKMMVQFPFCILVEGEPMRIGKEWNVLARKAKGDYLMMGNDDLVSLTDGWDDVLVKEVSQYDDAIFCAWFDDGIHGNKQCAFPIVSRRWVEIVGYFAPECFSFFFHDTWIEDLGKRVGRLHYIKSVVFEHKHFSTGKMERDVTTQRNRNQNQNKGDKDMYAAKAHVRNADVAKLFQRKDKYQFDYEKDSRLEEILTGKRVVLIGPAGYLEGKKMGEHFNDYDVVCRVNEVFPFGQEQDYGNRTDIIFHACSNRTMGNFRRSLEKNDFVTSQILFTIAPQIASHDAPEDRKKNFVKTNKDFHLYFHSSGKKFWEGVATLIGNSPNTGFLAIFVLLQYDIKELFISGFSFYKGETNTHSFAYQEWGGEDDKTLPTELHNQEAQIECLKNFVLVKWKAKVVVDSYLNKLLGLKYENVFDLDGLASSQPCFRCREDLIVYLKGKRVALVGPAPYLVGGKIGEEIDGYDVVCRVNEVLPFGLEEDYGHRTDIIFHCCGEPSLGNFSKALHKELDITQGVKCVVCPQVQSRRYRVGTTGYDTVRNFDGINKFAIPFYQVGKSYWIKMNNQIEVPGTANTGLLAAIMLLENFDLEELFITGFDFYTEGLYASQRHHPAYIEYGGDEKTNKKTLKSGSSDQSNKEHQQRQSDYFKNVLLEDHKKVVLLDSHLADVLGIKHKRMRKQAQIQPVVYAVYRVLYGEDFIQESIKSILPFVTKVFVFWTNIPFGDVKEVRYHGETIRFPQKFDDVLDKIAKMQKTTDKIELIYDHWGIPDNQVTHLVNDRILPYYPKPDVVIFMEPDFVWREDQLKLAFSQFSENGTSIAGSRQIELWKNPQYRIPERNRCGAVFYNMKNMDELPQTGKNGSVNGMKKLDAEVHNCGFCFSENTMFLKHLAAMAFAKSISDSPPREEWFEDRWRTWDYKDNNVDLGISIRHEKDIPFAEPYNTAELPGVLRR